MSDRAFDLAPAVRQHENHSASVRRDGDRAIKNYHDAPRRIFIRGFVFVLRRAAINLPEIENSAIVNNATIYARQVRVIENRQATSCLRFSEVAVVSKETLCFEVTVGRIDG
ncbi:hypothetical protein PQR57_39485 [Paraburkholderia dipogonis]|uniref:Uncharacterized protein n=1 Tax=Paraburkholderia dipogonis TaxID=1211383 RepID=A0ABW9B2D5_9BURK